MLKKMPVPRPQRPTPKINTNRRIPRFRILVQRPRGSAIVDLRACSLWPTFRFRNVNHRQRTAIPCGGAAFDVPRDVELVARGIDRGAEGAGRNRADLVLEV